MVILTSSVLNSFNFSSSASADPAESALSIAFSSLVSPLLVHGKGMLPNSENLSIEDIKCRGCLSDEQFMHCKQCDIRACTREKGYTGCHQCDEFPCPYIENFPMTVGKKVILRAIPYWREVGTEKWIQDEEARYSCPECGNTVFRGAARCNQCKATLDLD
ncbi:MAG: DUF3795 domain-containing protein [Deltaproteobacteria bacterium]|nr:MAG: DUF3795 domain-containing protein [Deltaproteobacteria bacterium]